MRSLRKVVIPLSLLRRFLTLGAAGAVLIAVYAVVGVTMDQQVDQLHVFPTPFDALVPLQPPWVVVYALVFLQAIAPIACVTDRRALDRTVGAYLTLYAFALPFWLFYPVTVPRTPIPIVDIWTYGIGIVRFVDPASNCLPSMHVGLAVMAALIVHRHDRGMGRALLLSAALIWWSTLTIRQHWATDGVVAALLALAADRLWFQLAPLPDAALTPLPRRWHGVWFAAYVIGVLVLMSGWWWGWVPLDLLPPNRR